MTTLSMLCIFLTFLPVCLQLLKQKKIKRICYKELCEGLPKHANEIFQTINELAEFCTLLSKPENHIKVHSGQFVQKKEPTRTYQDMTNEMAQELANLPRFTAYAKVVAENEGEQTIWRGKIKTLPLTHPSFYFASPFTKFDHKFCKTRVQIEEEIRQRIEKWRGNGTDEPPPRRN